MDLIGKVKDDIITLLQAQLPTKFNELDTRFADSITLPDIGTYYRYLVDPSARSNISFPAVVLSAGKSMHKEDEDGMGEVGVPVDQKWKHQVFLSVVHRDSDGDQDKLTKVLERLALGVTEVLATQAPNKYHLIGIDYGSPTVIGSEGDALWEVVIQLIVDAYEG